MGLYYFATGIVTLVSLASWRMVLKERTYEWLGVAEGNTLLALCFWIPLAAYA